jgi:hypothetical protein
VGCGHAGHSSQLLNDGPFKPHRTIVCVTGGIDGIWTENGRGAEYQMEQAKYCQNAHGRPCTDNRKTLMKTTELAVQSTTAVYNENRKAKPPINQSHGMIITIDGNHIVISDDPVGFLI